MAHINDKQVEDGDEQAPPSGVPAPHRLGASKREALWLALAVVVLVLMGVSFWYETAH